MKTIRASEISSYLYCKRAWWYRREGYESDNEAELAGGQALHTVHSRKVLASGFQRLLAIIFFLASIVALTAYLTNLLLGTP
ncbi:MAG: hypothetical protein R3335_07450 [Anaerolineales bacterium]|nr:hypothetical protein [Anaerolineales bacterium]